MTKWSLSWKYKAGSTFKNQCNSPYQQSNGQKSYNIDNRCKKEHFIKYPFMV